MLKEENTLSEERINPYHIEALVERAARKKHEASIRDTVQSNRDRACNMLPAWRQISFHGEGIRQPWFDRLQQWRGQ